MKDSLLLLNNSKPNFFSTYLKKVQLTSECSPRELLCIKSIGTLLRVVLTHRQGTRAAWILCGKFIAKATQILKRSFQTTANAQTILMST